MPAPRPTKPTRQEYEERLLATLMQRRKELGGVIQGLKPEFFELPIHKRIAFGAPGWKRPART
ncbi:MAG: hypothetical protein ACREHD_20530 [Pirellulales bacterium]